MDTLLEMDYLKDLNDIKKNIAENQRKAMMVANSAMIMSYHYIGTKINERNVWGNNYIKRLSEDLKDIPGMSYRNLYYMKQFAEMISQSEILQHPVAQIAWRTIIVLITKIKDKELNEEATVAKFATVQFEGEREVKRYILYYSLDVIISIGYRVKSNRDIIFRKWANQILKQYLLNGYSFNEKRCLSCQDNIIDLKERVKQIESEKQIWKMKNMKLLNLLIMNSNSM